MTLMGIEASKSQFKIHFPLDYSISGSEYGGNGCLNDSDVETSLTHPARWCTYEGLAP